MKIDAKQIKTKAVAGETKDGNAIVYIETVGGLHAFFTKEDGKIAAIGAAPHREIARFLSDKHSSGIKWNDDFITKSECALVKSEGEYFKKLRKMMFMPAMDVDGPEDIILVYDTSKLTIEIVKKEDFEESLKKGEYQPYSLARSASLKRTAVLIKDWYDT